MSTKSPKITPEALADSLFLQAFTQNGNDPKETVIQVLRYLGEAIAYAATLSCGSDESARQGLVRYIGEMIAKAPPHPTAVDLLAKKGPS